MASKKHNPGCPCCGFPCEATVCSDETTKNIRRVTLVLTMPDEIVLINPPDSGNRRYTYVSNGWSTINGTYTFELNLSTCKWTTSHGPDSSGIFVEAWLFGMDSSTDCSNYLAKIEAAKESNIPAFGPQYYGENDVGVEMLTTDFDAKHTHTFAVTVPTNGPFLYVELKPSAGNENLCGESPLVVSTVTLIDTTPDYDCKNLWGMTGTGNSYES